MNIDDFRKNPHDAFFRSMTLIWRREVKAEGQRQALMAAAHNMLQQGFEVPTIAKCLSLEEAEVLKLTDEL